ncbi:hypothetical protein [Nitrosopumilus sp.]|uniref:hypothetical protein n=1 Tax=Nitrosopumilus sp. TaxID=2024843 RepID=UPI002639627A|nr:hypothetical protein [Nitrosopumilus sp.]
MPFKILYSFANEEHQYTCYVTYEQYKNFKKLPSLKECKIITENQEDVEEYKNEMQDALNLAAKNDTSHIKKLSEMV